MPPRPAPVLGPDGISNATTTTTATTTEESAFGADVTNLVEEPRVSGAQSTSNNCSTTTTTEEEMERAFNDLVDDNTELNSNDAFNLRIRWLIEAKKGEVLAHLWCQMKSLKNPEIICKSR